MYAYVTHNDDTVQWKIVALEAPGPTNTTENASFTRWLSVFLFILAVLEGANFAVTVVLLLGWLKSKSENIVSGAPTPQRPSETRRICSECGREFSAILSTFCPYCFAYQGENSGSV